MRTTPKYRYLAIVGGLEHLQDRPAAGRGAHFAPIQRDRLPQKPREGRRHALRSDS
jgi:hypothetical protein